MRPICINYGCNKGVASQDGKIGAIGTRYRVYCGSCHQSNYSNAPLPYGVTPYRKNKCSNQFGRLGFPCITDHTKFTEVSMNGKFEIDHIDGNSTNNSYKNLQELCTHCHKEKGMRAGDYDKTKSKHGRKKKNRFNSVVSFNELFSVVA